jgi:simple sugar transport system ATP-binding protein
VTLEVRRGEVLGLLGDNGAGKSTLIKMVSGAYTPTDGSIYIDGEEVVIHTPADSRALGIETIYQDLALADNLDPGANIFLGRERKKRYLGGLIKTVDNEYQANEAEKVLTRLDILVPSMHRPIRAMSGGQRQSIAIARSIYWDAQLMIMDEPTAALGVPEQRKVRELILTLKEQNVPVIVVSHNMQDIFAVADRAIVLRHGAVVGDLKIAETNEEEVVGYMVGSLGTPQFDTVE